MGKTKKELLTSAPWRVESDDKFDDARLKVTAQPGSTPTMHVPGKKNSPIPNYDDESLTEIDPELRYSFQRNFQAFPSARFQHRHGGETSSSCDGIQHPEGIADAQKSLGLGQEQKARNVR
ncbi:hypothetical protein F511_05984 [Dorcoceras hygrometricum]|uniref:Uncharacterized protein n=1 Tax=Dorcoceras hygrometricum TaxID=472368 RepID=A0A2Z7DBW8_9LAMI|nr:hypothetical protein F511_05984 [Dorcoceras hygrometricum]